MTSEPIDVLEILDRWREGKPVSIIELSMARSAVAELIEAAKHAREALEESKSDPLTVGKLTRILRRVDRA